MQTVKMDKIIPTTKPIKPRTTIKGSRKEQMAKKSYDKEFNRQWIQVFTAVAQGLEFADTNAFNGRCHECQAAIIGKKVGDLFDFFQNDEAIEELYESLGEQEDCASLN